MSWKSKLKDFLSKEVVATGYKPQFIYVTGSHSVVATNRKLVIDGIEYTKDDKLPEGVKVKWVRS